MFIFSSGGQFQINMFSCAQDWESDLNIWNEDVGTKSKKCKFFLEEMTRGEGQQTSGFGFRRKFNKEKKVGKGFDKSEMEISF